MNKVVNSIKQTLNTKERNIVMAHGYVTYSKKDKEELVILEESDSEKPLSIGGTDLINSSCFEGFNYTALGHLHGPQKVGSNKIRYSGSLLKYSFSEIKQKKGITIVNIDSNGEIEIELFQFKPRKDFRIITGELQQLLKENVVALENKEDYIKAILKDTGELLDPMAKLRSVYPNVMELVREDRLKASSNNKVVASNINEKSKFDLFQNFYEDIIGEECSLEEIEVIKKVIIKAQKGCE